MFVSQIKIITVTLLPRFGRQYIVFQIILIVLVSQELNLNGHNKNRKEICINIETVS